MLWYVDVFRLSNLMAFDVVNGPSLIFWKWHNLRQPCGWQHNGEKISPDGPNVPHHPLSNIPHPMFVNRMLDSIAIDAFREII